MKLPYSLILVPLLGCLPAPEPFAGQTPSLAYSKQLHREIMLQREASRSLGRRIAPAGRPLPDPQGRAGLRLVADTAPAEAVNAAPAVEPAAAAAESPPAAALAVPEGEDVITNLNAGAAETGSNPGYTEHHSRQALTRDYNGPLSLGDQGVNASLWGESRAGNNIFRDERAYLPGDLITIVVMENAEGKDEADTDTKTKSSITAAISAFFGYEKRVPRQSKDLDPTALIDAETNTQYKGEGETTRKGSLKARISAMVAEVLPTGLMRIEGEKIVSVNAEEQVMVISGIVRPRDVNSNNEVDSSKVANMRVDYYGRGSLGEVQRPGWGMRIIRLVWPF